MSSFEPEAFGRYFLVDKIATGGMAEIFKAKTFGHAGFENLVVIKRILSHLSENEEFVEMFVDEAKVSVALQHTNIVRVYDFGQVLANYYIAMECVDGKDIRAILRKLGRKGRHIPMEFVLYVAHEAAKGLSYAHTKTDLSGHPFGIVHRDMSPSNVLVSYDGVVKIADFGIAKAEQNTYNTADGVLKGKFEYMSPEQARGEPVDARSDLFSLGILMHEMLTGRRLFKSGSDVATLEAIKAAEVRPPSDTNPRVPNATDAMVLKALTRDRDTRFQSAAQLQQAIRRLLPAPPDQLQQEFSTWLRDVFAEEIRTELARLQHGSELASQWRVNAPDSLWTGNTNTATIHTGIAEAPERSKRRRGLLFAGFGAVLLLFLVVGAAAGALLWMNPGPEPVAEAALPGSLSIRVEPAARIMVDGALRGEGTSLMLQNLAAGPHQVSLQVPGVDPYEREVEIESEVMAELNHTFPPAQPEEDTDAVVAEVTANQPPRTNATQAGPPRVLFRSTPPGASIVVNGSKIGTTPMNWTGRVGQRADVRLELAGHQSSSGSMASLKGGSVVTFSRTLKKAAATPGTLTIGIIGGGWGHVYIDGKKQAKTAPGKYTVAAGKHTIRIVNPDLGLDYTKDVSLSSGGKATVRASP